MTVLINFIIAGTAFGTDYTWTGGGGDSNWTTDANWDIAGHPDGADTATFSLSPALPRSSTSYNNISSRAIFILLYLSNF